MEQSILENSKGATYMSFILDIEIVIKKEGARSNVAESKAKSQVPKKGGSEDKNTSFPKREVNVYAVSTEPKHIFDFPIGPQQQDQAASSETRRRPIDSKKENIKKSTNVEKSVDKIKDNGSQISTTKARGIAEKEDPSENHSTNFEGKFALNDDSIDTEGTQKKKKKITKAEKKAKVFKSKVEAIDFLECNRIFLCNFLKITNSQHAKRKSNSVTMFDNSTETKLKNTNEKMQKFKSISNPIIHAKKKKPLKLFTYFTNNSCEEAQNSNDKKSFFKSAGDGNVTGKVQRSVDLTRKEKSTNISESTTNKYNKFQKMLQQKQTLIKGFKRKESTKKQFLKSIKNLSKSKEELNFGIKHSHQNLPCSVKNSKKDHSQKCYSEPEINDELCCESCSINGKERNGNKCMEEYLLIESLKDNECSFPNMKGKIGLSDLKVMFFNDTECLESQINCSYENMEASKVCETNDQTLPPCDLLEDKAENGNSADLFRESDVANECNKKNTSLEHSTVKALSNLEVKLLDSESLFDLHKISKETSQKNHNLKDVDILEETTVISENEIEQLLVKELSSCDQVDNVVFSTTEINKKTQQLEIFSHEPNKNYSATKIVPKVKVSEMLKPKRTFLQKIRKFTRIGKKSN